MTNNDLIPFYALACGKCYHEWDNIKPVTIKGYHRCTKCSKLTKSKTQFNPYVTFEDTIELSLEARKIIERQWPEMWDGYIAYILYSFCLSKNSYPHSEIFQQKHKPEYLYAYMKLHPEEWAYDQCEYYPGCYDDIQAGDYCPAQKEDKEKCTGSIPHLAWTWIKEREGNIEKH